MNYAPHTLALLATLATSGSVRADDSHIRGNHHGRIDLVHLDSEVLDRGPCIQMKPSIPGKSAWACLWRDNPLYPEILDLIMRAFTTGKRCTVYWDTADIYGHKEIDLLECWRT